MMDFEDNTEKLRPSARGGKSDSEEGGDTGANDSSKVDLSANVTKIKKSNTKESFV